MDIPNHTEQHAKPVILITGASGLIGSRLVNRLVDRYQCVALDKSGNPFANMNAESISLDITDGASIDNALQRVRHVYGSTIASVVHLAAYYDFAGEPSDLYDQVTVHGTEKLITALQSFTVNQFIFSSTNLIYKPSEPGKKIREDWPLQPAWDYPESKVRTEKVLREKHGSIPFAILRLAGVYNEDGNSIPIGNQIKRIYDKDITSHLFPGDVLHGNSFIHLDDLDDAFVRTVDRRDELPSETIMNIGESTTYSYDELQNIIGELMYDHEWKTIEIPKLVAKIGAWAQGLIGDSFIKPWMVDLADDHYELDISRAKSLLRWEPKHTLKATLPKIIENLQKDPEAWFKANKLNK